MYSLYMNYENYYYLDYEGEWPIGLDSNLVTNFHALGIEEISLEEFQVDKVLGDASYCGGDIPLELIERLELSEFGTGKKIYFKEFLDAQNAKSYLHQNYPSSKVEIIEKKEENWQDNWKQYYSEVQLLDGKITILPAWEEVKNKNSLNIKINPGQGFGTGTHETTQLCLEWIIGLKYTSVLDFGCGSGILGIGSQLNIPKAPCHYFDIDQNALDNCSENILLNKIFEKFRIVKPQNKNDIILEKYDLVFANILAPVLIQESEILKNLKSKNLILSGLLINQMDEVMESYNDAYNLISVKQRNEWVSLLLNLK